MGGTKYLPDSHAISSKDEGGLKGGWAEKQTINDLSGAYLLCLGRNPALRRQGGVASPGLKYNTENITFCRKNVAYQ